MLERQAAVGSSFERQEKWKVGIKKKIMTEPVFNFGVNYRRKKMPKAGREWHCQQGSSFKGCNFVLFSIISSIALSHIVVLRTLLALSCLRHLLFFLIRVESKGAGGANAPLIFWYTLFKGKYIYILNYNYLSGNNFCNIFKILVPQN